MLSGASFAGQVITSEHAGHEIRHFVPIATAGSMAGFESPGKFSRAME
jgi:hypothetical protein